MNSIPAMSIEGKVLVQGSVLTKLSYVPKIVNNWMPLHRRTARTLVQFTRIYLFQDLESIEGMPDRTLPRICGTTASLSLG